MPSDLPKLPDEAYEEAMSVVSQLSRHTDLAKDRQIAEGAVDAAHPAIYAAHREDFKRRVEALERWVTYICPLHGRVHVRNRAADSEGKFGLCRFCLEDGTERHCRREEAVVLSDLLAALDSGEDQ